MKGSFLAGAPRCADQGAKKAHLRRCPRPSSLNVRPKYASLLETSGALHLDLFDQPEYKNQPLRGSDQCPVASDQ